MSYMNENASKRRSERLYKGLDLASLKETTTSSLSSPKESLCNRLQAKTNTITSKIALNIRERRSKRVLALKQPEQNEAKNDSDDDCIVLSSDEDNVKSSSQCHLSTSTEASSLTNVILNEATNLLSNHNETLVTTNSIHTNDSVIPNSPQKILEISEITTEISTKEIVPNNIEIDKPEITKTNGLRKLSCVIVTNLETELANSKLASLEALSKTNNIENYEIQNGEIAAVTDDDDDEPIISKSNSNKKKIISSSESEKSENEFEYEDNEEDDNENDEDYNRRATLKNKWCVCDNESSNYNDKKMCDGKCGQWYHLACLGYSKEEIQRINNRKTEEENERFICPVCSNDQTFIEKYKKAIEYRRKHYSSYQKSSSSESSESEDSNDENIENSKSAKLKNELKEKIDKLKKNKKLPHQTKLIDSSKKTLHSQSSFKQKSSTLFSYKSLFDKTTSNKEKSKINTTNNNLLKNTVSASSSTTSLSSQSSSLTSSQKGFCLCCKKPLSNTKSVPNKLIQDMLFENTDELKSNWNHSIYCDEKCINNYIESELVKRQHDLNTSKHKESSSLDFKRKSIFLLNNLNKTKTVQIYTLTKTNEDLRKDIYSKITKQPKFFIVDLDTFDHLLSTNVIQSTNSSNKSIETKKQTLPSTSIKSSIPSHMNLQRTTSVPAKIQSIAKPTPPSTSQNVYQNDHRTKFKENLLNIFKKRIESNTSLEINQKNNLDELVNEIEINFHTQFQKENQAYIKRSRKVLMNLTMQTNDLYLRILNGQIKPSELPTLSDDMLNETRSKERQEHEKAEIENIKKYNDEVNQSKLQRMKKTHKGEELIDFYYDKNNEKPKENKSHNTSLNDSLSESVKQLDSVIIDTNFTSNQTTNSPNKLNFLNNKTVSPTFSRSVSMPVKKLATNISLNSNLTNNSQISPSSSSTILNKAAFFQSDSNTSKQPTNSIKEKERRHDSDFESEDEEEHNHRHHKPIEKPIIQLPNLIPTLVTPPTVIPKVIPTVIPTATFVSKPTNSEPIPLTKPADFRPIALLSQVTITNNSTQSQIISKPANTADAIDKINLNLHSSGPISPPLLHSHSTTSQYLWTGQIYLKNLIMNVLKTICTKANILKSLKQDPQTDHLTKQLVSKFQSMKQIFFECETKHRICGKNNITFWNYLCRLKKDYNLPLIFFIFDSNGDEMNSSYFNKDNPSDFYRAKDSEGFFHIRNNLDKSCVYEYKIKEELKSLIGYFYVIVLKAKTNDESQWFQENLFVDVDRNNKDVVLGVLIDNESKVKHSLPGDFSQFFDNNITKTIQTNRPPVLNQSISIDEVQKRKLSDSSNEQDELKRKKLDEVPPTTSRSSIVEESEPVHKIGADRDPRIKRFSKTNDSIVNELPNKSNEPILGEQKEQQELARTSSLESFNLNNKNDPRNQPQTSAKFDRFTHVDSILSKLPTDNSELRNKELIKLYKMSEFKQLNLDEVKLLKEKYGMYLDIVFDSQTSKSLDLMPPNTLWQGTDKESVLYLYKMHKEYAKNKHIRNFTLENENWILNEASFKKPNLVFESEDLECENEKRDENESNETRPKSKSPESMKRKPGSSHSMYSDRYTNNNNSSNSNNNNKTFNSNNHTNLRNCNNKSYSSKRNRSRSRSRDRDSNNKISRNDRN